MAESEMTAYLKEIGRIPILTKELQLLHCRRIRAWVDWSEGREAAPRKVQRQGQRSMELMTTTNLRLVVSIAKRFTNRGLDLIDLVQEGNIGLIRGLEMFDPTRGYSVTTYVYWWIRQSITRALQLTSRTIRLPCQVVDRYSKAQRFIATYSGEKGKPPSMEVIAEYMELPLARLRYLFDVVSNGDCLSLDGIQPSTGTQYVDLVACPRAAPGEYVETKERREYLEELLSPLAEEVRQVVERTAIDTHRLKDVATDLQRSTSQVRKLRELGMKQLAPRAQLLLNYKKENQVYGKTNSVYG